MFLKMFVPNFGSKVHQSNVFVTKTYSNTLQKTSFRVQVCKYDNRKFAACFKNLKLVASNFKATQIDRTPQKYDSSC